MPIVGNIGALGAALRRDASLLAIDVSKRHLGLAGSDPTRMLATALLTIRRSGLERDLERLSAIVSNRGVGGFVVGWPLNMDGTEGPRCDSVRSFAGSLDRHFDLPIILWDERLTTSEVETAIDAGELPRPRPGEPVDHHAAQILLREVVECLRDGAAQK